MSLPQTGDVLCYSSVELLKGSLWQVIEYMGVCKTRGLVLGYMLFVNSCFCRGTCLGCRGSISG